MSSTQQNHRPSQRSSPSGYKPPSQPQDQHRTQSSSSYFTYPVSHVVSGLYRRLTEPAPEPSQPRPRHDLMSVSDVFTPPRRTASPFQPPPLTPLTLKASPNTTHQLLTRSLAEEIRLLVPPRLQLLDSWQLVYSLDRDGSSLSTLYDKCKTYSHRSQRASYVLVIKDASSPPGPPGANNGAVFGAYLSDPPHPHSQYYGTGECFLWRASTLPGAPVTHVNSNGNGVSESRNGGENQNGLGPQDAMKIAGLPPPPSADTDHIEGRSTTFRGEGQQKDTHDANGEDQEKIRESTDTWSARDQLRSSSPGDRSRSQAAKSVSGSAGIPEADIRSKAGESRSGTSTPERIRFKAFPYSGVNDYMIFCETGFLSVGGGDGHYGLWLDHSFEKGVSSPCLTFGNETLSDEGSKFNVLGVEVWYIGS